MKRLLVLLVLLACSVQAEIYKSQNDKGEWVFSDKPSPDAERMKLPPLSTYTPPPVKQPSVSDPDRAPSDDTYKSMVFVAPANDATIRDNQGIVRASVQLDPSLMGQQGHKIQFYLDGTPYGVPVAGSNLMIKKLDRGTHALGARVINARGETLFSADPVTFFLHRESVNFPNRAKPTPFKAN
jgi:hypothetical protein